MFVTFLPFTNAEAQTNAEINAMKATFNLAITNLTTLRADNATLITENATLVEENITLTASLGTLPQENAVLVQENIDLEAEKTEVYNENVRITALLVAGIEQIDALRAQLAAGISEGDVAQIIELEQKITALEKEIDFKQEMLVRVFENARFLADRRGLDLPLQAGVWADLLSKHIIPTLPEYPARIRMCEREYAGSTLAYN